MNITKITFVEYIILTSEDLSMVLVGIFLLKLFCFDEKIVKYFLSLVNDFIKANLKSFIVVNLSLVFLFVALHIQLLKIELVLGKESFKIFTFTPFHILSFALYLINV